MLEASFEVLAGVLVFELADVPGCVDLVVGEVVLVIVEWRKEQSLKPAKEGRKRETHRDEGEGGGKGEASATRA